MQQKGSFSAQKGTFSTQKGSVSSQKETFSSQKGTVASQKGSFGAQKDTFAVAAIDFGTTYTGYAFYLKEEAKHFLKNINYEQEWTGSAESGHQAPTTVLFDKLKQFHSFGYEAELKYKQLAVTNDHHDWRYFKHFKMQLHHVKELNRDMMIEDSEGQPMMALIVFKEAIGYIKKHLLKKINESVHDKISVDGITWVLTVPAMWRASAKQFMRESATLAGIPDGNLTLALEPESAAIFCKELAVNKSDGVDGAFLSAFNPGEKYLVLDLGGGTVDTTVEEVLPDGTLKELHSATGGPWGGNIVNQGFEDLLEETLTPDVFRHFKNEHTNQWIEIQRSFEKVKREFNPDTEASDITIPSAFEQAMEGRPLKFGVEVYPGTLRLKPKVMNMLYRTALDEIRTHVESLLSERELKSIRSILIVGGFSASSVVSKTLREAFSKMKIVTSGNARMATLRGAVMYGIDPMLIAARVSPFSYGVHTRRIFNKSLHPESRKKRVGGRDVVDNAFCKHIEKGEHVYIGKQSNEHSYRICNRNKGDVVWKVFQSTEQNPLFCDEPRCKYIGNLTLNIPQSIKDEILNVKVYMTCQGTELRATATIEGYDYGKTAIFDFLCEDRMPTGSDEYIETDE